MTAQDIIATLAEDLGLDPKALTAEGCRRIRQGLEDGAALAASGITDDDQEAVECAHSALDPRHLTYTVNAAGLAEIAAFLAANHKLVGEHFTHDMLRAWATDAEFQLAEGNSATIEIKSWDSVRGAAIEYTVSDAGLDVETIEMDDE